jgi:hypothetical protein
VILRNAFISINGVDLSDECREVQVNDGFSEHDDTVMTHTAESAEPGLAQWTIVAKLRQNYTPGRTNATIRPLVGGAAVEVIVRHDAGPVGPANEQITGSGRIFKYTPISGAVGSSQEPTIEIKNAGSKLAYTTA